MTIETLGEMVDEVEPIVRYWAGQTTVDSLDREDVEQELRIAVIQMAGKFDARREVPWPAYVHSVMRRRAIDLCRKHGVFNGTGRQSRFRHFTNAESRDEYGEELTFDCECPLSDEARQQTELADLWEVVSREHIYVQAYVLRFFGLRMKDVGDRIGVTEGRVSQILSDRTEAARTRLLHLTHGRNAAAHLIGGRN